MAQVGLDYHTVHDKITPFFGKADILITATVDFFPLQLHLLSKIKHEEGKKIFISQNSKKARLGKLNEHVKTVCTRTVS